MSAWHKCSLKVWLLLLSESLDISCFTRRKVKQSGKSLADGYKHWTQLETKFKMSEEQSIPKETEIRGKFNLKKL